jgi:hypothetical protein
MILIFRRSFAAERLSYSEGNPMDAKLVTKLNKEVGRSFPELANVKPKISAQSKSAQDSTYLLTYKGKALLPDGRKIDRIVRVVADSRGRILKMTPSR